MSQEASASRLVASMAGVGFIVGVLIVVSYQVTLKRIERNKAEALQQAVFRVVPGARKIVPFKSYYACYDDNGELVGVAIEASGQGFQDTIRLIYGYSPKKRRIVGFEVLESKETPGLGDKIDSDKRFQENFKNLDTSRPPKLTKYGEKTQEWEIEGITGATISSRAVEAILKSSLEKATPELLEALPELERGGRP